METAKEICSNFATLKFPTKRMFLLIFVPNIFYYFCFLFMNRFDCIYFYCILFAIHKLMKVKMSTIVLF